MVYITEMKLRDIDTSDIVSRSRKARLELVKDRRQYTIEQLA